MEENRGMEKALQNPLVLDCIFKNLKLQDLKACRLVCSAWSKTTPKAMRPTAKVTIRCNVGSPWGPSKFLDLVESDQSTFFTSPFADKFVVYGGPVLQPSLDCKDLWRICGTQMKSLSLTNVTFETPDSFRHTIFLPNLESLDIDGVEIKGRLVREPRNWEEPPRTPNRNLKTLSLWMWEHESTEFSVSYFEILSNFPSLQRLDVSGDNDRCVDVFKALEICRSHDPNSWKVTEVSLKSIWLHSVPMPLANVFGGGGLSLTSLLISGYPGDTEEDVTAVRKILVANAHSLKILALSQNADGPPDTDIFPLPGNQVLEKVEALKLSWLKLRSTRFLQAFPNVKSLLLLVDQIPEDPVKPPVALRKCTEFVLIHSMEDVEDFRRLFELLPNLRRLKVEGIKNEGFSLICENWSDLTHLELGFDCEIDDVGISGYDEETVKEINRKGERGLSWRPVTVRRANLSSLRNLRSFFNVENPHKMSYASLMCGVSELPQLEQFAVIDREEYLGEEEELLKSFLRRYPWDYSQEIISFKFQSY